MSSKEKEFGTNWSIKMIEINEEKLFRDLLRSAGEGLEILADYEKDQAVCEQLYAQMMGWTE